MKAKLLITSGKLLVTSGTAACLGIMAALMPADVQAAQVNATLSWVTGDYGTTYDYSGPRLDMTINPDGSNCTTISVFVSSCMIRTNVISVWK